MKDLYPPQKEAAAFFLDRLRQGLSVLDASPTGAGKTVVAAHTLAKLDKPFGIIAPKVTLTQWERALKEEGIEAHFILSYEKLNRGNTSWLSKTITKSKPNKNTGKVRTTRKFAWNLPEDFVLVWDEVQRCSSPFTGNATAHILASRQGVPSYNLSATAAEDPTELRALGYALGLHNLDETLGKKKSWFSWMRNLGCTRDPWKRWVFPKKARPKLRELHDQLFSTRAFKVTREQMPTAFRDNHVIHDSIDFGPEVAQHYAKAGMTPAIMEHYLETGELPVEEFAITEMLRARQLAEAAKVPAMIEMISDLTKEGYSVPVFLNFRDSIAALLDAYPEAGTIHGVSGDEELEERQKSIDKFQAGESKIVLVQVQAGGTGLSLHDETGDHPRFALVSPSFDAKAMLQVFGRTVRNGMKSPVTQRVLVAADTIEEQVMDAMMRKIGNMDILMGN